MKSSHIFFFLLFLFIVSCNQSEKEKRSYDLVILGGRVIDPASGTDSVLNIAVNNGQITDITADSIAGEITIQAANLIVTAGFIDLHQHGQSDEAYSLMVRDGVTSGFELEVGTADVDAWYANRSGGQYVNYGVSIGHIPVRMTVLQDSGSFLPSGPAIREVVSDSQMDAVKALIQKGLDRGAVAVGFGLAYTPAATTEEFESVLGIARDYGATSHIHIRDLEEVIQSAENLGARVHIVHANSSGGRNIESFLEKIVEAQENGVDITTEAYPYNASMTMIESALFDDWEEWDDDQFATLQSPETGERMTRESFIQFREAGGPVIRHSRTQEMTDLAILHPLTMIASDGFIEEGKGHPRCCGTYSRVLGRYVRDLDTLGMMDALSKMNYEPARRLESYVPAMKKKGRLAIGADADITIFDPGTIKDKATYSDPAQPSAGMRYVIVNGQPVVREGQLIMDSKPGKPVRNPVQ